MVLNISFTLLLFLLQKSRTNVIIQCIDSLVYKVICCDKVGQLRRYSTLLQTVTQKLPLCGRRLLSSFGSAVVLLWAERFIKFALYVWQNRFFFLHGKKFGAAAAPRGNAVVLNRSPQRALCIGRQLSYFGYAAFLESLSRDSMRSQSGATAPPKFCDSNCP